MVGDEVGGRRRDSVLRDNHFFNSFCPWKDIRIIASGCKALIHFKQPALLMTRSSNHHSPIPNPDAYITTAFGGSRRLNVQPKGERIWETWDILFILGFSFV